MRDFLRDVAVMLHRFLSTFDKGIIEPVVEVELVLINFKNTSLKTSELIGNNEEEEFLAFFTRL